MKQKNLETFHKIFMELLNDLSCIKPDDPTLLFVKTGVSLLSTELLVDQFMSYIDPYVDKILKRDESFFINELHKDVKENSFASKEINKVRDIWVDPRTSDDTKKCIWDYFNILTKLGITIRKE